MNFQEAFDIKVEPGQSVMARLSPYSSDEPGDAKVTWSRGNTVETDIARRAFDRATREEFMAYRVTGKDGERGEVMAEFDPAAERITSLHHYAAGIDSGSMTDMRVVWNDWMGCWYDCSSPEVGITYVTTPCTYTATTTGGAYITTSNFILTDIPIPSTQERRHLTQRLMGEWQEHERSAAILRDEADKKATALLMSILTPSQRESYASRAGFDLSLTRKDGTVVRYHITKGSAGNIYRLDEQGRAVASFCIHAEGAYPDADHMVAQKLLLESDEQAFLRIANRTAIFPPRELIAPVDTPPAQFGGIAA